jgi:hypothetical protein
MWRVLYSYAPMWLFYLKRTGDVNCKIGMCTFIINSKKYQIKKKKIAAMFFVAYKIKHDPSLIFLPKVREKDCAREINN